MRSEFLDGCESESEAFNRAPWAAKVRQCEGGYHAFESHEDAQLWDRSIGHVAFSVGDRVRTVGLIQEDSDSGVVHKIVDESTVIVGWDSGVSTPCDVDSLELEE